MISIIICSTRKTISEILKKNIEETVGVEYELIIIDNSSNRYTIFEAYSEGVKLSQGNYLVFMHEDIMFRSTQWGQVLCELLTNKEIGAVGVIGSDIVLPMYFGWWKGGGVGHIIQNFKENKMQHASYPLQASSVSSRDALVLDGLFLGFRKEIFKHIEWDTITYGGFHMYDCDICMQVATKGYKIKVLDILIEHYSLGSVNRMFSEECIKFNIKWRDVLPLSVSDNEEKIVQNIREVINERFVYSNYRQLERRSFNFAIRTINSIRSLFLKVKRAVKHRVPYLLDYRK